MHEVAVAQRMVASILATAERHGGGLVRVARLDLGVLTCVDPETLRFAFEVACQGTCAQGCRLEIRPVSLEVRCRDCGRAEARADPMAACGGCGARAAEVLRGREIRLDTLDLE